MSNERDEDSIQRILTTSRQSLADVQTVIERGRVPTGLASAVQTLGPWSVGTIYRADDLQIYLYVASSKVESVEFSHERWAIYLGKVGETTIYHEADSGRKACTVLGQYGACSIAPAKPHLLRPAALGAQILAVLVG
jgi:hypothetical protein